MDDEREVRRYDRRHDPARVSALSDGVFAIAITLLVLEIHVPDLTGGTTLDAAMREVRPSFVAFLISFVVIAIAWVAHRELFALIRRTDLNLVWLNILYLLPVSILPFGAALIARYGRESAALSIYGFLLLLIAMSRVTVWLYATARPHLLFDPVSARTRTVGVLTVLVPAGFYGLAILISEEAPVASLAIYAAAPALYFAGLILNRSTAPPEARDRPVT
ncbi:MAG TPA: TMEM175 family protein [Actinomycetota bacterium]